jgi:tRNA-binding protein
MISVSTAWPIWSRRINKWFEAEAEFPAILPISLSEAIHSLRSERERTMEKPPIVYDDFARVDIRIGRIVAVRPFERARNPSYKVEVDFGPLGRKWSSAQITSYSEAELMGRLVACVVNMPPRNIAGFQSEVLILGAKNARADVVLLSPLAEIALGEPVF